MIKPTIICVDDEPMVLESLQIELRKTFNEDCYIEVAEGAEEALELLDEIEDDGGEVALIISDYIMPEMKGDELLILFHERAPDAVKIMLTGQASLDGVGNAINRANLYRFISKPWQPEDLRLTVNEAVRSFLRDKKLAEQYAELHRMNKELIGFTEAQKRFVPFEITTFLGKKSILDIGLCDQISKDMSVMFSDIRGFTAISENMTPQENFDFINDYLQVVSPVVPAHNGFIVKYIGDGMMAIFPESTDDAIQAGIDKLRLVTEKNARRASQGLAPIHVGVGIHTGHIIVGIIGEPGRMQGDAISDHVNLAARLEGLTKHYRTSFIISAETHSSLVDPRQYHTRYLGKVQVKGRVEPVRLFEVFDADPQEQFDKKMETLEDFEQAQAFFYAKELEDAKWHFQRVIRKNPDDATALQFLLEVDKLLVSGIPENWTGVTVMTHK